MAEMANKEQRWLRTLTVAASVLTGGLGAAALVGWITGTEGLTAFGADRIPMAPSTALLLLLFATLLLLKPLARSARSAQTAGWVGGAVGTTLALTLLILSALGIVVKAEHLGLNISGVIAGAPVGHMSPVTAICFVLAGFAYLFAQNRSPSSRQWGRAALGLALVLLLVSAILTAAYVFGAPLLYNSGTIPPALTTSLGFLALSGALLAHIGQDLRRYEQSERPNPPRPPYILFAIAGVLGLAIIGAAQIYFRSYQTQFRREIESELTAVAELKISEIVQWRSERLSDGRVFYANANFADLVAQTLAAPGDPETVERVRTWLDRVRMASGYRQVMLLDAQGALIVAAPSDAQISPHLTATASDILLNREVTLIDFHLHPPDDDIVLSVLTPILDAAGTGEALGALALEIDPDLYLYPMIQSWPSPRATAETLLVRREGDHVLFLNDLRFHQDAALNLTIPLTDEALPAALALHGVEGLVEGRDYRGVPVVAATASIPDAPWSLVAKIDTAEIYAPLRQRLWLVLGTVGVLLVTVGGAAGIVWQRRAQSHYRALYEAEARYGVTLQSIGDGVIATDDAGRVTLLNPVAEALTGWPSEDAHGRPLNEIFPIINETSRAAAENPVTRVLHEGRIVGLANHTLLIARDGREIPIADSGAPIVGLDGGVTGVVLIFRDQTEEREAQARLERERARAQQYLDIAGVMLVALDRQAEVSLINQRGCEILGLPEAAILGKNWFDHFVPQDGVERVKAAFGRLMTGEVQMDTEMENAVLSAEGKQRLIRWRNVVIRDDEGHITGVLSSGEDVTERREAQAALQRIEWMLNPAAQAPDQPVKDVEPYTPDYGDLVELNQGGLILSAVGREMLEAIVRDYLDLLDTSAAIYEANGDYALGIFSSGWCQLMDRASRALCNTPDNRAALNSGKWLCHESCWCEASLVAMQTDAIVDVPCQGGLNLYAVPIHAGDEIVGAINFGYGDPPQDPERLRELAAAYHLDVAKLRTAAAAYESRPPFIIALAKRRIQASAHLIGEIIRRKRATDALVASEEALTRAQRVAHVGSWIWHIQDNRLEWSPEMYRIFGRDPETFSGNLAEVMATAIQPEDRAAVEASNRSVIEEQVPIPLEYRIIQPDGTVRTVWAEAGELVLDDAGNPAVLTGVVQDITDRKAVEAERQALLALSREQAQQITEIIEAVPQGVLLLDADGYIQLTNPVAASQLALLADIDIYSRDAVSATFAPNPPYAAAPESYQDAQMPPKLPRLGDRPLNELLTSPPKGIWHEVEAGGRTFEVIARTIADNAAPERWVLVIQDVTEERLVREQLQQQARLAAVGQLAAGIAHDFNNIMGVIVLHAQMAANSETLSPRDKERLATINQQAHYAARLIEQILDFSRRGMLARQPLDLLPLIKEQVRLLQRTLPETITVTLDVDARPGGYTVEADPTRIQQVIMNLAVNARDAMPNGGTLQLALQHRHYDHHADVPLAQMEPGEWVALSVADSGSGIAPEALAHLFEPFYTTKGPGQGSGLGLAQVHGIVAQHEGYIDVQTESGVGTTFTIYLPGSGEAQQDSTDLLIGKTPRGRGQRVLVVEDNALLRTALCETLNGAGYETAEAANGAQALAMLEADPDAADMILSDVVMPQMGGVALAHAVRERGWPIPVILMSGHPRQRNLDELRAQGVADWLPKPPDLDNLVRAVAAALRTRQ